MVGEAGWGAEAQRDGLRYQECQRRPGRGNHCFLIFFNKDKVLISVFLCFQRRTLVEQGVYWLVHSRSPG